jgi:predicted pyridoxine 5'-phosphate oxidase superfamily flavin-nucleotide-binding protein
MRRVVGEQRLGFVATVSPDGTPNLSPKGTTIVWDDDHLAFADLRSPQTIANLRANPAVEVNLVDQVVRKGYRFKGTAEVLTEGELHDEIATFFESQRNVARSRVNAIVLITVTEARPLISPAYDTGASEEDVAAEWERYWSTLRKR